MAPHLMTDFTTSRPYDFETIEKIFKGVLNAELTPHYHAWIRNTNAHEQVPREVILEIAFWIGYDPERGSYDRDLHLKYCHKCCIDRTNGIYYHYCDHWIVMHFHIPVDKFTFPTGKGPYAFLGVKALTIFRSQTVFDPNNGGDRRAEWRYRGKYGQGGPMEDCNKRYTAFWFYDEPRKSRWYPGRTLTEINGVREIELPLLEQFGTWLCQQGIRNAHVLNKIWPGIDFTTTHEPPDGYTLYDHDGYTLYNPDGRTLYNPDNDAFIKNFLPDGHDPPRAQCAAFAMSTTEAEKVVPTEHELKGFDLEDPNLEELINRAQEGEIADHQLTLREALKKYKKAVFWAMFMSTSLIMEGYDLVIINSFYGQTQFQNKFGVLDPSTGENYIPAPWQSGLSNSAQVGQLFGLIINGFAQDRFGSRYTMMFFMAWMSVMIFIPVFAPSLPVLAWGEAMCGISWGVFQTLSTTYASEVVPTILRPYVTAYVCMCWGGGILLSSGVIRAVASVEGNLGWQLPFVLQWVWPIPLLIGAYLSPESPWNAVRRGKIDLAKQSLIRLRQDGPEHEQAIEATLANIRHTTALEKAESENTTYLECFKGTNLRRTEINCVVWAAQILCGNAILGYSVVFLQAAGFSEIQAFDINISLSACYIIGGIICWFLFPHFGRATIYISGLVFMFFCLVAIGALGWVDGKNAQLAVGVLLVISTLCNMITIGPTCYPIVAETPSGRLRYKTIVIGRFVYNLTAIFNNSVTPRMISSTSWNWGAKAGLFFAGTNLLCTIWCWFRLPETKDRTFGEIDLLFSNHVPARKFKYTKVDQFAH
ncbi:hypothetical protein G7Z17_g847 [Cylindrodendrum hubeiense]|uniref:Major facilitator superfamily (MFS) profile domain-containing protein n=1 Tax=Cylindrodendrum hubeiense TaxID=595255 RepID=A0A9P5HML8_9HYPO|nr:hypothetical protein G7Z17_g847 [Cylindrodendrum hubeiense]